MTPSGIDFLLFSACLQSMGWRNGQKRQERQVLFIDL